MAKPSAAARATPAAAATRRRYATNDLLNEYE